MCVAVDFNFFSWVLLFFLLLILFICFLILFPLFRFLCSGASGSTRQVHGTNLQPNFVLGALDEVSVVPDTGTSVRIADA